VNQLHWLDQLHQTLEIGNYGQGTIKSYMAEVRLLFHYHHEKEVERIDEQDIRNYMLFILNVHCVGRAKCRSAAQSFSFFYKHVIKTPFVLPSKLYPRKEFVLPAVMTQDEVRHLFTHCHEPRQRAVISLLYGCGMRLGEVQCLQFSDIERANNRILIRQGKGNKDRYTLLPQGVLVELENYYRAYRPNTHLFESKQYKGRPLHSRSVQTIVNAAMTSSGFASGKFTSHTLRHSFATHILDGGCDIHTIKTLMGHSKIETTMVYLHLQQSKRDTIVSPLDKLFQSNEPGV
jgi:site-specific recombinase XerD